MSPSPAEPRDARYTEPLPRPGIHGLTTGHVVTTPIAREELRRWTDEAVRRLDQGPRPTSRALHKHAAAGAWNRLELVEQLGNVGSEVERAIRFHSAGRTSRFEGALERALELFDLTAADPRWHGHRCQEILRAREEFCRLFFDPDVPSESAEGLRKYFYGFAHAARMLHYRRQAGEQLGSGLKAPQSEAIQR